MRSEDAIPVTDPVGWVAVEENGSELSVAFFAGEGRLGRAPDNDDRRYTVTVTENEDGTTTRRVDPFTEDDRREVEALLNDDLAERGIPPRPPGFRWFLKVPTGWPADVPYDNYVMNKAMDFEPGELFAQQVRELIADTENRPPRSS
jgi:hypothetical protein